MARKLQIIKTILVQGDFIIRTSDDSDVQINDFNFYDLSVEYEINPPKGMPKPTAEHFQWSTKTSSDITKKNKIHFSFSPFTNNFIIGNIKVSVKGFDGSLLWGEEFAVDNNVLQNPIKIEVPLKRPKILRGTDETAVPENSKMLHGRVLELSGKCVLKGLTVLLRVKKDGDPNWTIVDSATTDGSGNFSTKYPYGIYVAAQAIVSLTPNSPVDIVINNDGSNASINRTIADDFLYLLLTDVDCTSYIKEEDCECNNPNKPLRLPGHEELINSDDYTQDIGGSCVNLSTPNRTLNEYSHRAVVRTSDPDIANYILIKEINKDKVAFILSGSFSSIQRKKVDITNQIYWQDAPNSKENLSIYQAVSVATGHILHYKVIMKSDGYSLGELLYSLPLAPGQKKEIVVLNSLHTLKGTETQLISQRESLATSLVNDVTISDTLAGNIGESMSGSSSATTGGASGGFGLGAILDGVGISLGVAGGIANANSTASQNSSRSVAEAFAEKLRNSITQNAQSYRELNASVITTVQEGQQYGVSSEVVANHNHCHSLTMMYFEVLRHYAIYEELSQVEECLFIPLLMTNFSIENIYKWRDVLATNLLPIPSDTYLQPFNIVKGGRQHPLLRAFDAIERKKTFYVNVDYPAGSFDDEIINFITGELYIKTNLPRPKSRYDRIKSWPVRKVETPYFSWTGAMIGSAFGVLVGGVVGGLLNDDGTVKLEVQKIIDDNIDIDDNFASVPPAQCIRVKDFNANFFTDSITDKLQWTAYSLLLGYYDPGNNDPDQAVYSMLRYYFQDRLISEWDSIYYNEIVPVLFEKITNRISIGNFSSIDFSIDSKYKGGEQIMKINLRGNGSNKKRKEITELTIKFEHFLLPLSSEMTTLNIRNLNIRYSTSHYNGLLYSGFVNDDLIDGSVLPTPENANEKRDPHKEDTYLANKLIEHLNSYLEYYNKILWQYLDSDRRYMLLDGFSIQTFDDYGQPFEELRSLASVVKNEVIGIAGNSLVMPVAPGYKIDRSYILAPYIEGPVKQINLFDHYKPLTPIPPYRISIPTKGVYAEAVMGQCDACEKEKENTSQNWTKFTTDEPTPINPITTPVPTITDWKAAFKDFAPPIVNIQNAPATPAPGAGLSGISDLLGKSDVFKDVTGLDANQKNVLQTYLSNQENAKAFAEMAKEMTMQAHNTQHSDSIADSIRNSPELSKEDKAQLLKDHFNQIIDGGASQSKKDEKTNLDKLQEAISSNVDRVNTSQKGEVTVNKPDGTNFSSKFEDSGANDRHLDTLSRSGNSNSTILASLKSVNINSDGEQVLGFNYDMALVKKSGAEDAVGAYSATIIYQFAYKLTHIDDTFHSMPEEEWGVFYKDLINQEGEENALEITRQVIIASASDSLGLMITTKNILIGGLEKYLTYNSINQLTDNQNALYDILVKGDNSKNGFDFLKWDIIKLTAYINITSSRKDGNKVDTANYGRLIEQLFLSDPQNILILYLENREDINQESQELFTENISGFEIVGQLLAYATKVCVDKAIQLSSNIKDYGYKLGLFIGGTQYALIYVNNNETLIVKQCGEIIKGIANVVEIISGESLPTVVFSKIDSLISKLETYETNNITESFDEIKESYKIIITEIIKLSFNIETAESFMAYVLLGLNDALKKYRISTLL